MVPNINAPTLQTSPWVTVRLVLTMHGYGFAPQQMYYVPQQMQDRPHWEIEMHRALTRRHTRGSLMWPDVNCRLSTDGGASSSALSDGPPYNGHCRLVELLQVAEQFLIVLRFHLARFPTVIGSVLQRHMWLSPTPNMVQMMLESAVANVESEYDHSWHSLPLNGAKNRSVLTETQHNKDMHTWLQLSGILGILVEVMKLVKA
jgi:hypothetical protein